MSASRQQAIEEGRMSRIKALLHRCRYQQSELDSLTEKRDYLYSTLLPQAIRYSDMNVQTSGAGDRILEKMPEIKMLDREIRDEIRKISLDHTRAMKMIRQLKDARQRQALQLYYIVEGDWWKSKEKMNNRKAPSWRDVAGRMGYSEQRTYDFAAEGIKQLEKRELKDYSKL